MVVTVVGIYLVFGPRRVPVAQDFTLEGIKANLAENINLGLDLKGGSHLVMRVKTEEYLAKLTENTENAALLAAKEAKDADGNPIQIGEGSWVAQNGTYSITINVADPTKTDAVIEEVKKRVNLVDWTESVSGGAITWALPPQIQSAMKEQATEQAVKIIESRINAFGVKEPTLSRQGSSDSGQIVLQMPGVENPERVKALIGETSRLELAKIVGPGNPSPVQTYPTKEAALQSIGGAETATRKVRPYSERDEPTSATTPTDPANKQVSYVVIEYPAVVDGSELRDAAAVQSRAGGSDYTISFSFKPSGAQKFGEWTGRNINNYMAVVLNDEVKSAAYIKSQIFDSGEITGRFTKTSADDLALTLRSGALPAALEYQEERTVGPSLGADSIRAGVAASIGGLVFVLLFMLFYYRGAGINAVVALVLNMILTMAALVYLDSTLTLPGIAGLILGIGMAVDSNVLIFERIREELLKGNLAKDSINVGFAKAFVTIIDTNTTTIIAAIILYVTGSGPVRGFAVTLILGLLINLFTAVFVSRTIFYWLLRRDPQAKTLSI